MKEAIIFVSGFDAQSQNYFLDNFLVPGLLTQLEDLDIKLDPEDVKIPGQTGKRFYHQLETDRKIIDIYEVYWNDLVNRLSSQDTKQKLGRGLSMIFYWIVYNWKIAKISPAFFFQTSIILILILLWYFGIVVLFLAAIANQPELESSTFIQNILAPATQWATNGFGWQVWLVISAVLTFLPLPINFIVDLIYFLTCYLRNESIKGTPPIRALLRNRVKQSVDNVTSEGSYDKLTVLSHSMGGLIATDFLADYHDQQSQQLRFITWGTALESSSTVADWLKLEIKKCLENPYVGCWDDFYSKQDWLCSKVPVIKSQSKSKLVSKHVSFKVSLFKQFSGESHMEYFFDSKVLRNLIMG
ncbi:serine aminopeptidase domain-containing protein [Almyronema epifaneia]|uniref:Serine aminopeptidase domain-containing protein n=1 Tax=Almyronema epifaneia S1 TaxID=2991925 RepID=A0ABW6IJL2_9CYAN